MNIKDLERNIKKLNNNLDGISDDLVIALKKYQIEYERLIRKQKFDLDQANRLKTTGNNFNIISKLDPMNVLGFNTLAISHINTYDNVADEQIKFNARLGIVTDLSYKNITVLQKFKEFDLANMMGEASQLDSLIKKQLVNAVALNTPWHDAVQNLATDLLGSGMKNGRLERYAETYMRTSLFGLSRTIDKEIYNKQGAETFLYVGPEDKVTRPFCEEHVGNEYTMDEIEKFPEENDSGLDPFFAPGGFNCRHRLIPVSVTESSTPSEEE